jgi:hypothetical protein
MKHFQNNQFRVLETPRPKYIHGEVQGQFTLPASGLGLLGAVELALG